MPSLYFDLLQLTLLLLSFAFLAVVVKFIFKELRGLHLIIFIFSALLSGLFFNDTYMNKSFIITLCYPFFIPLFYAIGPALWLHYKSLQATLHPKDLLHYLTPVVLLLDVAIFALTHQDHYQQNLIFATDGSFLSLEHSFFFSGTFLFTAYPFVTFCYALFTLGVALYRKQSFQLGFRVLLFSIIVLYPFLQDIVNLYITEIKLLPIPADTSRVLLTLSAPPVLVHAFLYLRNNNPIKNILKKRTSKPQPIVLKTKDSAALEEYINAEKENPKSILLQAGITKDVFIPETPFSREEWDSYFNRYETRFSELKKQIRIEHAKRLIKSGYLQKYSVEALSLEVGYRSRTSFYNAFEQVTGNKLATFRMSKV